MFRCDIDCLKYMTIEGSLVLLVDWLKFQFGTGWLAMTRDIFYWLSRKNFKKGGFEVVGDPNSGKSFFFGALIDVFMLIDYVRPNSGYTFNYDDCLGKQIIRGEEFKLDKADWHTVETLKWVGMRQPSK